MTGSSEGKAGEEGRKGTIAWLGLRKLQDYSFKDRGPGSGEDGQP